MKFNSQSIKYQKIKLKKLIIQEDFKNSNSKNDD